ncbi:calcium/sodium antiporter [Polycladidibacter stylochi]|uniref:calcium/sodium antiporter n=1 Tax=Polycladidibacter stylochi TaxID=1807766 RepID=UPI00082F38D1|nr:calcium/sodium antiporter [Pseudovibrio stylochi]
MPHGYIYLIGGMTALIFTGDLLVRGAVGIAQKLGIPSMIIGLTIVAFGTSAPELMVSIKASLNGNSGIAIGNIVGSNIANVLMVLGLPALLFSTSCNENGALKSAKFMIFISFVFVILMMQGTLGLKAGFILLTFLGYFLYESFLETKQHRDLNKAIQNEEKDELDVEDIDPESIPSKTWVSVAFIIVGLIGLPISAKFAIDGATVLARSWGVTDAVIGLTVVALGTSLPELSTTLMAAMRNHSAVALGNVIGSNIFNILAIMGITSIITPVPIPQQLIDFDVWVMLSCAGLVLYFATHGKQLGRRWGLFLTISYIAYTYAVFILGKA